MIVFGGRADLPVLPVLGEVAFGASHVPKAWAIAALSREASAALLVPDMRKADPAIRQLFGDGVPRQQSLIMFLISPPESDERLYLLIANPDKAVFESPEVFAKLQLLVNAVRMLLEGSSNTPAQEGSAAGFRDVDTHRTSAQSGSAEEFLLNTLVENRRLLSRNQTSYTALRKWRSTLKPYQISTFSAVKRAPSPIFIGKVADELVKAAKLQFGARLIRHVVPVPCGSSGRPDCLSVKLAESAARKLGCEFANVLSSSVRPGTSHPKRSAVLQPFRLERGLPGPALVIDDIATSGRHMELALTCLREHGIDCFGIAWAAD